MVKAEGFGPPPFFICLYMPPDENRYQFAMPLSAICRYLSGMPTNDPLQTPHLSKPPTDHRQINRQMFLGVKCVKSGKYSEKYTSLSSLSPSVDLSAGGWGCARKTPSPALFACCTYRAR